MLLRSDRPFFAPFVLDRLIAPVLKVSAVRRRWHSLLTRVNFRRHVQVAGADVIVPSIRGVHCELSEAWMTELLQRLLPLAPGTFIDVGVNLGQTLVKVRALESRRRYVGLEPNAVCVFYVNELIRANGFSDCTIVPAGLHTDEGLLMLDLYSADATDSGASLVPGFREEQVVHARVPVPVVRFDRLASLLPDRIGLVKIDVEGAELEVVRTLQERLRRDRPPVLVEVLPVYSADNGRRLDRQIAFEQVVAALDYLMLRILKNGAGGFAGARLIESIGVHGDLQQCDYVLAPREALGHIEDALRVQ